MAGKIAKKNRKTLWLVIAALCVAVAVVVILLLSGDKGGVLGTPTLTVETPQKCSAGEEITLNVTIDHMGEALYPAASMSIRFDPACLEFLGVEEGNVFILDGENTSGRQLPQWSYNTAACNESGLINVMYLDMTGGRYAFSRELLAEEDNVVLRLSFRVRGSVRAGDVLDLIVEDAVFAASEEKDSLAMTRNTLRVRNSRIVIGE
ncbi:MAG: hypothetical protein J6J01_04310 [Oscillospiraceae bacterium]|nr:hypothetical protein [Oscillospiraceae bacterium]MBP3698690.1 hypothetical protein [Oscillospiraceae bacterium]